MHRRLPSSSIQVNSVEKKEEQLSLREKWQLQMMKSKQEGKGKLCLASTARLIMLFQAFTELYVFKYYIFPFILSDYDAMTRYYFNVLLWFIVINMLANWLCVTLYDPSYPKSKDNPFLKIDGNGNGQAEQFTPRITAAMDTSINGINSHCVYDFSTKENLPREFCDKCSMYVPFRAHHCWVCQKCILKRDHHCYLVGNCIGFKNQRYFTVLSFFILINCLFCGPMTYSYVKSEVWPGMQSWTDAVLPVTIWRSTFGGMKSLHCVLMVQLYLEISFGLITLVYFNVQMALSLEGKTLYEVTKKLPVRNTNSFNRNMKSVFGDYWALNFLFPMILIFPQRDDGIHWEGVKIEYNTNGEIVSKSKKETTISIN